MLDALKSYLDITWEDAATETKASGVSLRAVSIINSYAGVDVDYDSDGLAMQLYLDCGRYIWNNAYEDFEANFLSELVALRAKYEIAAQRNEVNNED